MKVKKWVRIIDSNDINRGQFLYSMPKTRRIAHEYREYKESDISLNFHVVFGMERPKVKISWLVWLVGFHLT